MPSKIQVEYYRCWPGNGGDRGHWDVDVIEIPASTPAGRYDEAIQAAVALIGWTDEKPAFVGLYHKLDVDDLEVEDEDGDENCPHEPDWNSVSHNPEMIEGSMTVVDVNCKVCGRSGSVPLFSTEINW